MDTINTEKEKVSLLTKVKNVANKYLTGQQMNTLKKIYYKINLNSNFKYDKKNYIRYSFGLSKDYSLDNLRGKITLHYHSIEKGMSIEKRRLGFGKRAFSDLFFSMDKYIEMGYPTDDERILNALNIIGAYIEYHEKLNYEVTLVKEKFEEYKKYFNKYDSEEIKANRVFNKDEIIKTTGLSFENFVSGRVSVRNYSDQPVDIKLIDEAIEVSMNTPSVCNRQPWQVYVIKDYEKVQDILNIQQGLNTKERSEIKLLLAVTTDVSYYANNKERNEPFVDGGLFSMSLLYALHNKGLAACALNANQSNSGLDNELKLIGAKGSERLILFISVGNYKEDIMVPLSNRDDYRNHVNYV